MFFTLAILFASTLALHLPPGQKRGVCAANQCLAAVQSADSGSADCSAFMTKVVTSTHSETFLTEINYETTYSTTPVTVYALPTTTSASEATLSKRQTNAAQALTTSTASPATPSYASACNGSLQYASACSCMGITASTYTYPLFTAVTTSTFTATFSEVARATQTAAACDAATNYGLFAGIIDLNTDYNEVGFPIGEPRLQTLANYTAGQCCNACFTSTDGCLQFSYDPNATCTLSLYDGGCPNGVGDLEAILYPNDEKPLVGLGPCDVEVSYFIEG